jgi:hypothetical protein
MDTIEEEILQNDPLTYESTLRHSLGSLHTLLDDCKVAEATARQELTVRQLQETVEKNKLAVHLGKLE